LEKQLAVFQSEKNSALSSVPAPTGNVTLVFTDVQGSTTQWEKHPEIMAQGLKLHNHAMRSSFPNFGGYEVKTEGDAFMLAFQDPIKALSWCIETQNNLLKVNWPEELYSHPDSAVDSQNGETLWRGMRVRMGVHCGEPSCEPDPVTGRMDYFGQMVNRSARVESCANGGQIVISGDVWDKIQKEINKIPKFVSQYLGERELKGLSTTTHIYEILPIELKNRKFAQEGPKVSKGVKGEIERMKNENKLQVDRLSGLVDNFKDLREHAQEISAKLKSVEGKEAIIQAMKQVESILNDDVELRQQLLLRQEEVRALLEKFRGLEERYEESTTPQHIDVCCKNLNILKRNIKKILGEPAEKEDSVPKLEFSDLDFIIREFSSVIYRMNESFEITPKDE